MDWVYLIKEVLLVGIVAILCYSGIEEIQNTLASKLKMHLNMEIALVLSLIVLLAIGSFEIYTKTASLLQSFGW